MNSLPGGGALTTFPCKYGSEKIFSALGGARAPLATHMFTFAISSPDEFLVHCMQLMNWRTVWLTNIAATTSGLAASVITSPTKTRLLSGNLTTAHCHTLTGIWIQENLTIGTESRVASTFGPIVSSSGMTNRVPRKCVSFARWSSEPHRHWRHLSASCETTDMT